MNYNGYNFGYSFGVPRSESNNDGDNSNNDNNDNTNNNSRSTQNSQDYSIDLSQITPPTFRFGQFGQFGSGTLNSAESAETNNNTETEDTANHDTQASSADNDSFLAEPSISIGQFDASFSFPSAEEVSVPQNNEKSPVSEASASEASAKSTRSPILVEELAEQPVYLEEPAPHSVEELLKATIDGDTSEVMMESWENVGIEEIMAAQEEFHGKEDEEEKAKEPEIVEPEPETAAEPEIVEPETAEPEIIEPETVEQSTHSEPKEVEESKTKKPRATKEKKPTASKPEAAKTSVTKPKKTVATKPEKTVTPKSDTPDAPVTGKRQRKTVERLTDTVIQPVKPAADKSITIPKGSGVKLGEIEVISQNLNRKLASDKIVTMLHKVIFDRVGDARSRKSNLRSFCGIDEENSGFEAKLQKFTNAELKDLTTLLGLSGGNEKSALASKISNFLIKPSADSCKSGGETKKKISAAKATAALKKSKASATRTSKRQAAASGTTVKPPRAKKSKQSTKVLTPEIIDSDVESEVEREVLNELKNEKN